MASFYRMPFFLSFVYIQPAHVFIRVILYTFKIVPPHAHTDMGFNVKPMATNVREFNKKRDFLSL